MIYRTEDALGIDRMYLRVWWEHFVILRPIAAPQYFFLKFSFCNAIFYFCLTLSAFSSESGAAALDEEYLST